MIDEYLNYLQEDDVNEGWLLSGECKKMRKQATILQRQAIVADHDKNPAKAKQLRTQATALKAKFQKQCAGVKKMARQIVRTAII